MDHLMPELNTRSTNYVFYNFIIESYRIFRSTLNPTVVFKQQHFRLVQIKSICRWPITWNSKADLAFEKVEYIVEKTENADNISAFSIFLTMLWKAFLPQVIKTQDGVVMEYAKNYHWFSFLFFFHLSHEVHTKAQSTGGHGSPRYNWGWRFRFGLWALSPWGVFIVISGTSFN